MKSPERRASAYPHDRRIAGRAQSDAIDDPYARRSKPGEPTVCSDCGAVFHAGRWQWGPAPGGSERALCAACQRIRDDYPAGVVSLAGGSCANTKREDPQPHPPPGGGRKGRASPEPDHAESETRATVWRSRPPTSTCRGGSERRCSAPMTGILTELRGGSLFPAGPLVARGELMRLGAVNFHDTAGDGGLYDDGGGRGRTARGPDIAAEAQPWPSS